MWVLAGTHGCDATPPESPPKPETPAAPEAPAASETPVAPEAPAVPEAPAAPEAPETPEAPPAPAVEREDANDGACTSHALANTRQPCCDALDGIDAEALRESCGFSQYRGQSQDWGCTHTFSTADGKDVTFRVTDRAPLSTTQAIEVHEAGFTTADPLSSRSSVEGIEGAQVLAHGGVSWAFVPRGSHALRMAWPTAACSVEDLTPTLRAMGQSSPAPHEVPVHAASTPAVLGTVGGTTLLDAYADRPPLTDADFSEWSLPFKSKRILIVLLITASRAETRWLPSLLAPNARYGWPDRRELAARPIFGDDDGTAFMAEFAAAAHRLPKDAPFETKPQLPDVQKLVTKGEAGMWATYRSDTPGHEIIVHLVGPPGHAKIDYVGFYPEPPATPITPTMEPPEPPKVLAIERRAGG